MCTCENQLQPHDPIPEVCPDPDRNVWEFLDGPEEDPDGGE